GDDFDAAAQYDKDSMAIASLVEKELTRLRSEPRAECREALDLRIVQSGEHVVGLFGSFRHDFSVTSNSGTTSFTNPPAPLRWWLCSAQRSEPRPRQSPSAGKGWSGSRAEPGRAAPDSFSTR